MTKDDARAGLVLAFLAALVSASFGGCETGNPELPYAPDNCSREAPDTGFLIAQVTINAQNPAVKVTVFVGDWEDGVVALEDSARDGRIAFQLPSDESYSVLARYLVGRDTVLALDGAKLVVKSEEFRDATCFSVPDVDVNVRLALSSRTQAALVASRGKEEEKAGG